MGQSSRSPALAGMPIGALRRPKKIKCKLSQSCFSWYANRSLNGVEFGICLCRSPALAGMPIGVGMSGLMMMETVAVLL